MTEISEQSSPQDNLEIHQEGEGSEPRSHQDEILVNQEEIMSVDAGKHLVETQNEVKTDVFKLDKPVKPEEAGEPLEPGMVKLWLLFAFYVNLFDCCNQNLENKNKSREGYINQQNIRTEIIER